MWNVCPYTVFDTGTLDGLTGAVDRPLVDSRSCICFSFSSAGDYGGCESNL